ncbi:Bug family tripartite tricarboxylate transporter substrate binding protein [Cupriavidus oxalaticus]|jgi:tripartite-type tricarboxylate transporter receptor subunit TctC|uniref:ABC transporter substrate-binding protein n=1 Tax=Cupriavidus oxalaticus TaxID=96344 RepID=A0A375FTW4_9BURK|nr:tripartite tricarboxylate transporter substrate binding protein [Cupriavidus oxalaticus]QEZ44104.1 tripartite tricarboxylate transporter substrate binding protein [Cupriavidus oxalaticus]QRQ84487.1 tripartite tricarboxylate transporter substrate binding protein [Cupriavidus oxalaticus]QRQ91425.1 tripartite tricarboxylate transporter substrate binding protein [Cupriavidus oxalaticus]WQD85990.1 tripartite tricarboxylate transporter substrate binding protein [Cupriavidus oxalaticus]SPC10574.1 
MHRFRKPLAAAALCALVLPAGQAWAEFPDKPIRFVVPFAAGSATDQLARAIGQAITLDSKVTVVVDNKPGANGFIAASDVAKAAPDGYTVLISTNTTHAANEHLFKKLPYDPVKDYAPVTALGRGGQIMVVNPQVPARTVGEFIALAKKQPGKLSFGSGSSSSRIAGELFQQMAHVELLHVPYKSNPLAITDLLGNQIQMMITDTATGLPQVKSGKLRALGVSGKARSPLAPDVPTIDEAGVKGYEMSYWFAAYAPAGTPQPVVAKLNAMMVKAARSDTAASFYQSTGTEVFTSTPAELVKFQAQESGKWGRIIKAANIQPE